MIVNKKHLLQRIVFPWFFTELLFDGRKPGVQDIRAYAHFLCQFFMVDGFDNKDGVVHGFLLKAQVTQGQRCKVSLGHKTAQKGTKRNKREQNGAKGIKRERNCINRGRKYGFG